MAPETRSRGVPAPSRVYNSTPALQQAMFPPLRRKIRTYGRQTPATLRQQTLTQIDFVSSFDEDDVVTLTDSEAEGMDKENKLPKGKGKEKVGEEQEDEQPVASKGKRPATGKPAKGKRNKRRRTLGDETEEETAKDDKKSRRKTLGDAPASSNYHTQTLTQFLGQRSFVADSDDDLDLGSDNDKDDGFLDWLGEPGSPSIRRSQTMDRASPSHASRSKNRTPAAGHDPSREESVIPQTPIAKRTTTIRFDVPPSGGLHSPSTARIDRYGPPDKQDSPLKDRSSPVVPLPVELTGVPRHLDATPTRHRKPPLVIQDSFATESWGSPSRSQARATPKGSTVNTPTKAQRERHESAELGGPAPSLASSVVGVRTPSPRKQGVSPKKTKSGLSEIPDSDEEDDGFEEETVWGDDEADDDGDGHFLAGAETQLVMSELASTEEQQLGRPSPALVQTSSTLSSKPRQSSSTAPGLVSSTPTTHPVPSSSRNQPLPPPSHSTPASKPIRKPLRHPLSSQLHSQPFESQRVPLSILQSFPPHAARSDILLPIAAPALGPLLTGHAVHVHAPFKIPAQVVRFWLLDGDSALLRYMACVELPGEEAAAGGGQWQYFVRQVYELNNPMREADMREEGWVDGRIGKYVYLPPAVIGQLLWNLRHAIFGDGTEEDKGTTQAQREDTVVQPQLREQQQLARDATPAGSMTVSQQVAAQIHSDIAHSTQFIPSTPDGDDGDDDEDTHHQHPAPTPRQPASSTMKPPPSITKPARTPARPTKQPAPIRPSQATTASQSSTPEKPNPRPPPPTTQPQQHSSTTSSSSLAFLDHGASLVSLPPSSSLPASQLLTKSQMLPDSLVRDGREPPPPPPPPPQMPTEIWDSDDDDV
ncbi:Uncharacterized protein TPAR_02423 [Tolypocladium paradoxum]|uniref:Uncharacterized protein n=1 Tax=Tolypocladium paradoxum TaxID=94208 RepID=A0A2S4L4L2_9HYPO|nr:Uncharacterized protein TPAR_02423 [Tolypocladium paradoxum]